MIRVELVGGEENGNGTYTKMAEFEKEVASEEAAENEIQTLVELAGVNYAKAADEPSGVEAVTVTLSLGNEVSPAFENRLTDKWGTAEVSLRFVGEE